MELRRIKEMDLKDLYDVQFTSEMPEWAKLNAPYFNEYKFVSYDEFLKEDTKFYLAPDNCLGIYVDNKIIGVISRYWESKDTRWLEVGLVIYDESYWGQGIGYKALNEWIDKCFKDFPEIERVGLTTWSGNYGMMKLALKLGMKEEARIRKVRYWQGYYHDSMKYGILREEYYNCKN